MPSGKEVELTTAGKGDAAITKPDGVIHGIEHFLIPVGQLENPRGRSCACRRQITTRR
jgi:hypothetical protein